MKNKESLKRIQQDLNEVFGFVSFNNAPIVSLLPVVEKAIDQLLQEVDNPKILEKILSVKDCISKCEKNEDTILDSFNQIVEICDTREPYQFDVPMGFVQLSKNLAFVREHFSKEIENISLIYIMSCLARFLYKTIQPSSAYECLPTFLPVHSILSRLKIFPKSFLMEYLIKIGYPYYEANIIVEAVLFDMPVDQFSQMIIDNKINLSVLSEKLIKGYLTVDSDYYGHNITLIDNVICCISNGLLFDNKIINNFQINNSLDVTQGKKTFSLINNPDYFIEYIATFIENELRAYWVLYDTLSLEKIEYVEKAIDLIGYRDTFNLLYSQCVNCGTTERIYSSNKYLVKDQILGLFHIAEEHAPEHRSPGRPKKPIFQLGKTLPKDYRLLKISNQSKLVYNIF